MIIQFCRSESNTGLTVLKPRHQQASVPSAVLGEHPVSAPLGCWQESVPWKWRTEILVIFLTVNYSLLLEATQILSLSSSTFDSNKWKSSFFYRNSLSLGLSCFSDPARMVLAVLLGLNLAHQHNTLYSCKIS